MGENFRFGQRRQGRRRVPREPTASSRRAWCRWWRPPARPSPRATSAASWRPARWRRPPSSWAARSCSRARSCTGDRRGRELGMPTANLVPDERYVVPGPRRLRARGRHGHPAAVNVGVRPDLRHRPRPPGRGPPDRLRRRHLRRDAADRLPGAPARREALRLGRCADRARPATRRRTRPRSTSTRPSPPSPAPCRPRPTPTAGSRRTSPRRSPAPTRTASPASCPAPPPRPWARARTRAPAAPPPTPPTTPATPSASPASTSTRPTRP